MRSPISARLREMVWLRRKPALHIITVRITNEEFGALKWCWMGKPGPTVVNLSQLLAGVSVLGGRGDKRGRRHPCDCTANEQGSSWRREKGLSKLTWQTMQGLVEVKREKLAGEQKPATLRTYFTLKWNDYHIVFKKRQKNNKSPPLWDSISFHHVSWFYLCLKGCCANTIYRMSAKFLGVIQLCKLFGR